MIKIRGGTFVDLKKVLIISLLLLSACGGGGGGGGGSGGTTSSNTQTNSTQIVDSSSSSSPQIINIKMKLYLPDNFNIRIDAINGSKIAEEGSEEVTHGYANSYPDESKVLMKFNDMESGKRYDIYVTGGAQSLSEKVGTIDLTGVKNDVLIMMDNRTEPPTAAMIEIDPNAPKVNIEAMVVFQDFTAEGNSGAEIRAEGEDTAIAVGSSYFPYSDDLHTVATSFNSIPLGQTYEIYITYPSENLLVGTIDLATIKDADYGQDFEKEIETDRGKFTFIYTLSK
ncbi:MAG: hypothetical protein A3D19_08475 [Deltaproteobacteria bacterium RIFCSPHIGHO2_02_FULL_38_15]|nr:MAG: hypothetical protein A3D19_08475 [Deltaproteobacteria bacterium RIFCSPHIGHO2_02_FULL_38_15]OGQ33696.1 MAG: hypothetical protein A3A72_05740 [Deltaproteobacteria bacterium RIFCSPLOWO2_01_FULL_38_9]OGQ61054.1 MAG: hypothetical protein A3G92_01945 [Deltaproteobacteria bacterium RIFCSPLOWO2_12_FULL_38_8]HBQ21537.1 hypothetical protein [Deltaproteobacteria bacterium]